MKPEKTLILIALFCFMGCSTFNNSTAYMDRTKGLEVINYKNDVAEFNLQFNPDVNFGSVGFLGVPAIPLYFKIRKVKEVVLNIELLVFKNKSFSVSARPCLQINDNEEFCPRHLDVYAIGLRDSIESDGHYWIDVCNFRHGNDIHMDLPKISEKDKIDKDRLLRHYSCPEGEKLDYLRVHYSYTYQCRGSCPKKIILNVNNIIQVDGLPIEDHHYIFERTLHNEYVMMWEQLQ